MKSETPGSCDCTCKSENSSACGDVKSDEPFKMEQQNAAACCGGFGATNGDRYEKPGYRLWGFVEDFKQTPTGDIPRIKTGLCAGDYTGSIATRFGIGRNHYRVSPGLYCIGNPDSGSAVLVTANYKLTFDTLRRELVGVDAWIMVLETFGVNVWCAAGKGTFSTDEVIKRVNQAGLKTLVDHRNIVLPQLGATGVQAREVKKQTGFEVRWGPVHAKDLALYLKNGMKADSSMRRVTFSLMERLVLTPLELSHMVKPTLYAVLAIFLLSGFGKGFFSMGDAISRGSAALAAYVLAVFSGAVLAPVLLPWLPGRAFSVKGAVAGTLPGLVVVAGYWGQLGVVELIGAVLFALAISSYLAMNFTGSTPYTSPTGVEKEMRRAIPFQLAGLLMAAFMWVGAGFAS